MMAAARIPADTDPAIEREVARLWARGKNSFDIAEALMGQGYVVHEAAVCIILERQRTWRLVDKRRRLSDA